MSPCPAYPPATRGLAIVWGILARYPFGGVTWQALHHLAGLRQLGFDVWYVEDSDSLFSHPESHLRTFDATDNVAYMRRQLERIGLADRWMVRVPASDEVLAPDGAPTLTDLYARADMVFNVCGAQELLPQHDGIRRLIYLESDPAAEQVRIASGDDDLRARFDRYQAIFTYGENIGHPDCQIPDTGHRWRPTRPPVCLDWWATEEAPRRGLTTVANWRHQGNDVHWNGQVWRWSKHLEFQRFLDLPSRVSTPLEIALGGACAEDMEDLRRRGWSLVTSISDPDEYLRYIQTSAGEFTAAKEQYVAPRSGWFSDRSACYLAAGRPVVTQDTGFGRFVPTGEGLFAVSTVEEAASAVDAIASDYARHSKAAREVAREYFDAAKLLSDIVAQVEG